MTHGTTPTGRSPKLPDPKEAHSGVAAGPFGQVAYVAIRHDGKMVAVEETRHDAIGVVATMPDSREEWFHYVRVPVGAIPITDVAQEPYATGCCP